MDQTRLVSFIEANLNVAVGFFISLAVWVFIIVPWYEIPVTPVQNLEITGVFTIFSVARAYVIRRFFNNGWHLLATKIANKIKELLT